MILVSDANVLIDLGHVGGIPVLPLLAETEVLDLVLQECDHPSLPGLCDAVTAAGIKVIPVDRAWIKEADAYRQYSTLSLQDRLNIFYAKTRERVLVTGDLPLRDACQREVVELRGSIWIVEQAYERGLVGRDELLRWLEVWPGKGRRLPKGEVDRLIAMLQSHRA